MRRLKKAAIAIGVSACVGFAIACVPVERPEYAVVCDDSVDPDCAPDTEVYVDEDS